jgi:hypothetical protein
VERRALVEDQRDVGVQRGLDLHRRLGPHEDLVAVARVAEGHALLGDPQHRLAARPRAGLLDLVGHVAVAHREDLEAARVGDDRPLPPHELVQAAELVDELVARVEPEVERVAQDHVEAERLDLPSLDAPDDALRRQRHEGGGPHRAVRGAQQARPGAAFACRDLERGHP